MPSVSSRPWIRPSSPQVPWSAMRTTSSGSALLAIARVAGTSACDALWISFSRPRGSSRSGSRRAPPLRSSRAWARCSSAIAGLRTMSASGSRSRTSYLSFGSSRSICAPVASEMSRSADAPPVSTPTRIFFMGCSAVFGAGDARRAVVLRRESPRDPRTRVRRLAVHAGPRVSGSERGGRRPQRGRTRAERVGASPFADELDFGHELDAELLAHGVLAELHQRAHIFDGSVADVHDEVRVLRAHHRAALGGTFQASGLDEPTGVIARGVAEDRARVRLRERLLRHPLVGDLLDAFHHGGPVARG